MGHTIKVIFSRTNTQGLVLVFGLMVDNILVSGTIVLCMAMDITVTKMEQHMKVSGKTDASMEKALTGLISIANHVKGNGKKVKEKNGLKMFEKNS